MKPVRILVDSTVDLPERCRAQVRARSADGAFRGRRAY